MPDSQIATAAQSFLGPSDFDGTAVPGPSTPPQQGGRTTFDGDVVFANLPRDVVAEVLSPDVKLATNSKEPTLHPIILIMSHHAHLTFLFPPHGSEAVPGAYDELILLIPFVKHEGDDRWHNYAVHMYLNSPPPIWIGNLYYGYSKEFALIDRVDTGPRRTFSVRAGVPPKPYFAAETTSGSPGKPTHYDEMRKILAMPILGHMSMYSGTWFICSYWHWDDSAAAVAPIDGEVQFIEEFVSGMGRWKQQGKIANVPGGACRLAGLRWSMTFPPGRCGF